MSMNSELLFELLEVSTMTLATSGAGGEPHAAAVYFAADEDLRLYFFSDPQSQHGQDLARERQAAVSFYPHTQGWQDIRGVQMRGEVRLVEVGPEWEAGWAVYTIKFPFVRKLKAVVAQNSLYVFMPYWIRLVDNTRGFGFKQEWTPE
jgi:uncharacterized protein YhbP (UPF0306 family)